MSGRAGTSHGMNSMSDRFFLDTNIFIYALDGETPKAAKADALIRKALASQRGITSYQVVQEFFNVALRRFTPPMSASDAENYLAAVFRPVLAVHSSIGLFSEALRIQKESRLSWYDSLIVSAARQTDCDVLYTEDLQHGQKFGSLRIVNPFL
jgi:predicted nucleic acid-binding protein